MLKMKDMKVATRLRMLVAISTIGLIVLGLVSYLTLGQVKVGGPLHAQMQMYADLNADIVPPSLNLEQVRFAALKMMADSPEKYPEDIALFQERKQVYLKASDAWKQRLPEGKLKDLVIQAGEGGKAYLRNVEEEMIPALQRGDRKAAEAARSRAVSQLDASTRATNEAVDIVKNDIVGLTDTGKKSVSTSLIILISLSLTVILLVVVVGLTIGRGISSGTQSSLEFANAIAAGNLAQDDLKADSKDELSELGRALNKVKANLREMVADAGLLSKAAIEGKLSTRADASKHQGDYRKVVEGVNKTLDSVIGPLNVAAEYVEKISKGEIPPLISDQYSGEFNQIKNNLNTLIHSIKEVLDQMEHMSTEHDRGDIDVFMHPENLQGAYRTMAAGVNGMVKGHITVKKKAMACLAEFAKGNFEAPLEKFPGKKAFINENIEGLRKNLKEVARELNQLIEATIAGKLATRAQADAFAGDWKKLLAGLNELIEAFVKPIHVTADYVDKISKGEIPAPITDDYNGDFNAIKNNLNTCIKAVNTLVADTGTLARAAVEGKLSTRADAGKHQGDYRKIVEGVNQTLDAVISPVQEAGAVLKKIAAGDLTAQVAGNYQGDHADIKNDINAMTEALRSSMRSISENAGSLSTASEELTATSQQMSANAEETSAQANVVSASAEQVDKNLQTVATGTEEMSASIKEIAKNAHESAKVATAAVKVAEDTNQIVSKLGDSSTEIGQVIKVITSIAQQTNLLALNATIEAARAGEAGKGFAVVANEVKELAKQTAKATEDISRKIEAIQGDTKSAVSAIGQISSVIKQVNDISNTIATAVEEQNATTNEMARNVGEAAKGSGEITKNISGVADAAKSTSHGANDSLKASQALAQMSTELRDLVSRFKIEAETHTAGGANSKTRTAKAGA